MEIGTEDFGDFYTKGFGISQDVPQIQSSADPGLIRRIFTVLTAVLKSIVLFFVRSFRCGRDPSSIDLVASFPINPPLLEKINQIIDPVLPTIQPISELISIERIQPNIEEHPTGHAGQEVREAVLVIPKEVVPEKPIAAPVSLPVPAPPSTPAQIPVQANLGPKRPVVRERDASENSATFLYQLQPQSFHLR